MQKLDLILYVQNKKTKKVIKKVTRSYSPQELEIIIFNARLRSDVRVLALIPGGKKFRRF